MKHFAHLPCLILAFCLSLQPLNAQSLDGISQASLLTGWRAEPKTHVAAIRIKLAPGWKTYWRAPGDAGIPPRFDWSGSQNVAKVDPVWPTPHVFDQSGMRSIGYDGTLVLPLKVTPQRKGQDVTLSAKVDIGLCKDVCVPQTLTIKAVLPAAQRKTDPKIAAALADRAYSGASAGLGPVTCSIAPASSGLQVTATVPFAQAASVKAAILETDNPYLWVSQPKMTVSGGQIVAVAQIAHVEDKPFVLNRKGLRMTLLDNKRAIEVQGCAGG